MTELVPSYLRYRRESECGMPSIGVTEYTVYPTGYDTIDTPDKYHFTVTVNDRGKGWGVTWMGDVLNKSGEWEYEPRPSSRDDEFFKRCRFGEHEAKALALEVVDRITINGRTFADVVRMVKERENKIKA